MTTGGPKKPGSRDDDAWERLRRANRAAAEGRDLNVEEIGDTDRLLRRDRTNAVLIEGPGPANEILQLVTASLEAEPERADLWMMRFEVQKTLGLRREFADALVRAWTHPRLSRLLDWAVVRDLWDELAPGEIPPEGVRFPQANATMAAPGASPAAAQRGRRFSDLAERLAARELAVLAKAYEALRTRPGFFEDYARLVAPMLKRPTPLQLAEGLSGTMDGKGRIYFKREDQRQVTPEQENAAAHAYLAAKLQRSTVVTGNDVDAHSLALATLAPRFGLKCIIIVRPEELQQKAELVQQLRGLGAELRTPETGMLSSDAREGALRLWQQSMGTAHLALSLGTGPNPYPTITSHFQSLLGRETALQLRAKLGADRAHALVAAVESEGDSIGFMLPHLGNKEPELVYAEPEPGGISSWRPSTRMRWYNGAIREHAWLRGLGRIEHVTISDAQARATQRQVEGIEKLKLSLEDARAVALAQLMTARDARQRDYIVLVA